MELREKVLSTYLILLIVGVILETLFDNNKDCIVVQQGATLTYS